MSSLQCSHGEESTASFKHCISTGLDGLGAWRPQRLQEAEDSHAPALPALHVRAQLDVP